MSSNDYYSVVKTDKLQDIVSRSSKEPITSTTPQEVDIFTSPLKKSAIASYDKIVAILSDNSLNNIEKLSQIKQLKFNFDSDFEKSQNKNTQRSIPIENTVKGLEGVTDTSPDEFENNDVHHKVLKTKKNTSRDILEHFESRGLEFDNNSFQINTSNIEGLEGRKIYMDDLLNHLTKKTQKLSFGEKNSYNILNKHFDLPQKYIHNNILSLRESDKGRRYSDSTIDQLGSGLLTNFGKNAATFKKIKKCKHLGKQNPSKDKIQNKNKQRARYTPQNPQTNKQTKNQNKIKWLV